jgi:hypothetical protein
MAQQISVNVYQINSMQPIPLASVTKIGFPTQGILIRGTDVVLNTGVHVYGNIQVAATGSQYLTIETAAQLVTLANA